MKPAAIDPPEVHRQLWHGIQGGIGWDIGANCGQTLGEMTRRFREVVAFEPAEECEPYLNRWRQDHNVLVMPCAVSDVDGEVTLAALPDKIDTGQLVTPGTHGMEWNPDVPEAVARTVPSVTVDSLIGDLPTPEFMKIDVEGHELHVLRGAGNTIAEHRPTFLIEFHTQELLRQCAELLMQQGYDIQTLRHPHYPAGSPMWFTHGWFRAFPR